MQLSYNLILFILFLYGCSSVRLQQHYVSSSVSPGEITKVSLPEQLRGVGSFQCEGKKINVVNNREVYFLWGESYFSDRKSYSCEIYYSNNKVEVNVSVIEKKYDEETLRVDRKKVVLSISDQERVKREREMLAKIYKNQIENFLFEERFEVPLKTMITSPYGVRRMFNNRRKSQHLGIDFRARTGKSIPVSNAGRVVLSQDLFYTGNTVIVEHGFGLFTMYGHLSEILVNAGDIVTKRQVIGLAGATGRVTGPHLHWGVKLNGSWVNGDSLVRLDLP